MDLNFKVQEIIICLKSKERIIYNEDTICESFQYFLEDGFIIIETIHENGVLKELVIPSDTIEDVTIIKKENVSSNI